MKKVIQLYDRIVNIIAGLAAVLLVFITVIVTGEVAYRIVTNRSLGWVEEVTSYCLLIIGFLAAPWVLKVNGHVRMDLVFNALGPRVRRVLATATSITAGIVSLVLFYYATLVTWDFQQINYFNPTVLAPPKFVFIAVIAFGFLLLTIESARMAYRYATQRTPIILSAETGVSGEQIVVRGETGLGQGA
jgi:C4-dicarboxylate transporter DctQ subunit